MVFATFMARLFPATRFRVEHRTLREDLKGGEHGTFPGQRAFLALGGGAPWAWVSACSFIASGGTGAITFLDHKTLKPRNPGIFLGEHATLARKKPRSKRRKPNRNK